MKNLYLPKAQNDSVFAVVGDMKILAVTLALVVIIILAILVKRWRG